MHPIVLLLFIAIPVGAVFFAGNRAIRSMMLLALAAFCGFGFLASFEPPGSMAFKVGYALLGLTAMAGAVWPWIPRSEKLDPGE